MRTFFPTVSFATYTASESYPSNLQRWANHQSHRSSIPSQNLFSLEPRMISRRTLFLGHCLRLTNLEVVEVGVGTCAQACQPGVLDELEYWPPKLGCIA
ncbi:uncharacterized protein K444DRAFT_410028 [Hyaloscypha bicolor E]|uniref:Uncharacterized protein n=1 Tax=Hyaloscypha bicolor E TaxID=1095630 RepID=A0A2J6T8K5_9HELO|nr:uncharacterized protein K444DRAFT_410028 [Hyaloscypha bicolor E]PMD59354.1 hypothetical protein K444DRAFT_410028 [Hyaloscypha bicolor E]